MLKNWFAFTVFFGAFAIAAPFQQGSEETVPIATQWLYDAAAPGARGSIDSVVRIVCTKTNSVGSGFALDSGYLISNHHVVQGCSPAELNVVGSNGRPMRIESAVVDEIRDLAALKPRDPISGSFQISRSKGLSVGTQVTSWGYPFGHPGPAPLLTVGYLSGFRDARNPSQKDVVKQLVINGAFNPGNSGGVLLAPDGAVVGVVVAKILIPLPPNVQSIMSLLAGNKFGLQYEGTRDGKPVRVSESQLVVEVLDFFRRSSQVSIGYAVAGAELIAFLDAKGVPWSAHAKTTSTEGKPRQALQKK